MDGEIVRTLIDLLKVFRPALTAPTFARVLVVFVGWVRTSGMHAVTEALVITGVAGRRHHEAYHRFFSRGTWSPDELGRLLFEFLRRALPAATAIRIVLDDTVAPKKGPHVFGIGTHVDATRSTKRHRVFTFGHCWVVLAVLVRVPFSSRAWALPILLRLYRNEKECVARGVVHRKKTQLAREMLDIFRTWVVDRRIELSADGAYCNDTVMRGLPSSVVMFGAMRPDAVLTASPTAGERKRTGRRRVRGKVLPKPQALAGDQSVPWQRTSALLYGRRQIVHFKTCCAQWYRACGAGLVRVVVVRIDSGRLPLRVFFSTDHTVCVPDLLEIYAGRWNIEVCFRELKQLLGFSDSSARKRAAVERVAPFVAICYSTLVTWAALGSHLAVRASLPLRPWYSHKRGLSFADILRTAQRALTDFDVLDPRNTPDNLRKTLPPSKRPSTRRARMAA